MTSSQKRLVESWFVFGFFVVALCIATKTQSAIVGLALFAYVSLRGDVLKESQHLGLSPRAIIEERPSVKAWLFLTAALEFLLGIASAFGQFVSVPKSFGVVFLLLFLPLGPAIILWQRRLYVQLGFTERPGT